MLMNAERHTYGSGGIIRMNFYTIFPKKKAFGVPKIHQKPNRSKFEFCNVRKIRQEPLICIFD